MSNDDHGGRTTPRERRNNSASQSNADDDMFTMSEQTDLLGLVSGNILKGKNVRGDGTLTVASS